MNITKPVVENGKAGNLDALQAHVIENLKMQFPNLDENLIVEKTKQVFSDPTLKTYLNMLKTDEKKKQAFISLTRIELEKIAAMEQVDMFVVGRYCKRSKSNEWAISTLLALVPDEKQPGSMKLTEINIFERAGEHEQLYRKLQKAFPLQYYKPHVSKSTDGRIFIQGSTEFVNGKTLAEIDEAKYGEMTDEEILQQFLNLPVYDSIVEAGVSDMNENGFPINTSLKAVRLLVQNIRKSMVHEAFPDLYNYFGNAIDFDGSPENISVIFGGFNDLSYLENSSRLMGIAVGTISFNMENRVFYYNIFHWIPIE